MIPTVASDERSAQSTTGGVGNRGSVKEEAVRPHLQQDAGKDHEPAVGASVCASGSQVCRGKSGTFTAKATKNA